MYALYNLQNAVQYVGYSRNMVLAVKVRRARKLRNNLELSWWAHIQKPARTSRDLCALLTLLESYQACT